MTRFAGGFDPELYRLVHRGNDGDVRFYLDACRGAETVLELGCGDGRVLLPLARAGHAVTGLERHPGMLAVARERASGEPASGVEVDLLEGDMAALELGRRFDRILIPYCGLYCLPDDAALAACLGAIRRHLEPSGVLLFDAYAVHDPDDDPWRDAEVTSGLIVTFEDGDRHIEVYERSIHVPAERRIEVTYDHLIRSADGTSGDAYTLVHHYVPITELEDRLRASGLVLEHLWGGFDRSPFTASSEHLVVSATAA